MRRLVSMTRLPSAPRRGMGRRIAIALVSALVVGDLLVAQTPVWTVASTSGPSPRYGHCMAYDAARGVVVLYGGTSTTGHMGDTWTWDGASWTSPSVQGPSARRDAAMAYDRARQKAILFGGINQTADTWEWDGSKWTQLQPAQSPVARANHAMAYDEVRQRIVLFGGDRGSGPPLGDTWEWDGATWIPRFSAHVPPARSAHGMAFDMARSECVLFGGSNGQALGDTWTWDGIDWQDRKPASAPNKRALPALAYHQRRQVVVLFGGSSGSSGGDTWYWEPNAWTLMIQNALPNRWGHAMVYDEARDVLVMFGGHISDMKETWLMTVPGIAGQFTPFGQSCGSGVTLASKVGSVPRVNTTFQAELRSVPPAATGAAMLMGTSKQLIGPFPLPLALEFLGMPGCWLYQDAMWSDPVTLSSGLGTWSLKIPPLPGLAGARLFLQGLVALPGANPAGVISTNAGDMRIGQ